MADTGVRHEEKEELVTSKYPGVCSLLGSPPPVSHPGRGGRLGEERDNKTKQACSLLAFQVSSPGRAKDACDFCPKT